MVALDFVEEQREGMEEHHDALRLKLQILYEVGDYFVRLDQVYDHLVLSFLDHQLAEVAHFLT